MREYPQDSGIPRTRQSAVDVGEAQHRGAIRRLAWSRDATRLATASADQTVGLVRAPLTKHAGTPAFFTAHAGPVVSVAWNVDSSLLLSASTDRTVFPARTHRLSCPLPPSHKFHGLMRGSYASQVRLWSAATTRGGADALLTIDNPSASAPASAKVGKRSATPSSDTGLGAEVRDASFFYLNRLILAAVDKQAPPVRRPLQASQSWACLNRGSLAELRAGL